VSDEPNQGLTFDGASQGQDVTAPAGAQPAEAQPQPSYVTRADLEAAMRQAIKEAQSMMDKKDDTTVKAVNAKLADLDQRILALRAAGYNMTEADVKAAKDLAVRQVLMEGGQQAGQPVPQPGENFDNVNRQAEAIFKRYGIIVTAEDDEAKEVDMSSPEAFIASLPDAAMKKKARLAQASGPTAPPEARMPGNTASGPPVGDEVAQLTQELERLNADPNANEKRRREVIRLLSAKMPTK
jgi:hypothetical protein